MGHGRDEPNRSEEVVTVQMETRERTNLNSRSDINHSLKTYFVSCSGSFVAFENR